ncbi:MAG: metallophosphoesterase [Clostridia bacterium]|nr:metallophosphoesterase [Clostridia bacterium]
MKILVVSDSHGAAERIEEALFIEKPDVLFHLGDGADDCDGLRLGNISLYRVCGNNDFGAYQYEEIADISGKRFFLCHGHRYGVRYSYQTLKERAETLGADAVLFGHTHEPLCAMEGKMLIMNPGSIRFGGTYGVVTIENGKINGENRLLR